MLKAKQFPDDSESFAISEEEELELRQLIAADMELKRRANLLAFKLISSCKLEACMYGIGYKLFVIFCETRLSFSDYRKLTKFFKPTRKQRSRFCVEAYQQRL